MEEDTQNGKKIYSKARKVGARRNQLQAPQLLFAESGAWRNSRRDF
jgi:hypothetical protein